jgi:hypothetical protein
MHAIGRIRLEGTPPPWGITSIDGFIQSALSRAQREGSDLPDEFHVTFCPWGERNTAFHNLWEIADVFEPRYRLVHFTSCGRPYLIAILTGADAAQRQRRAMQHLPWSEHYRGRRDDDSVTLYFIGEAQDVDVVPPEALEERSLRRLFQTGEIQDL